MKFRSASTICRHSYPARSPSWRKIAGRRAAPRPRASWCFEPFAMAMSASSTEEGSTTIAQSAKLKKAVVAEGWIAYCRNENAGDGLDAWLSSKCNATTHGQFRQLELTAPPTSVRVPRKRTSKQRNKADAWRFPCFRLSDAFGAAALVVKPSVLLCIGLNKRIPFGMFVGKAPAGIGRSALPGKARAAPLCVVNLLQENTMRLRSLWSCLLFSACSAMKADAESGMGIDSNCVIWSHPLTCNNYTSLIVMLPNFLNCARVQNDLQLQTPGVRRAGF